MRSMHHVTEPDPIDVAILRIIAAGRLPDRDLLSAELRGLHAEGLINDPAGALPTLTPRGQLLLQVANGECATPVA